MKNTAIEWADHTFNPWVGCTKVSPACDHCYAEGWAKRSGMVQWGPHAERRRTSASNWRQPLKWNAEAERLGLRYRVFCASLADVFDNAVDPQWRQDLFTLIQRTPNLDWLLLTKRIGNVPGMVSIIPGHLPPNVWLGATVVNQAEADRDIPKLLSVPAAKRFLSMEPLLGPVTELRIAQYKGGKLDWVIVGGESGPSARPMHPDWARGVRTICEAASIPFFFKQWGEWVPRGPESMGYPLVDGVPRICLTDLGESGSDLGAKGANHAWMQRVGKKAAGRLLDGREWNQVP